MSLSPSLANILLVAPFGGTQLKAEGKGAWMIEDVTCRGQLPKALGREDKGESWIRGSK